VIVAERSLVGVFFSDITGHTIDVFHDLNRIFENVGVDSLEKVGRQRAVLGYVGYLVGRVDIADRNDLIGVKFTGKVKFFSDLV
jgi:hypothetical protein